MSSRNTRRPKTAAPKADSRFLALKPDGGGPAVTVHHCYAGVYTDLSGEAMRSLFLRYARSWLTFEDWKPLDSR